MPFSLSDLSSAKHQKQQAQSKEFRARAEKVRFVVVVVVSRSLERGEGKIG